MAHEDYIRWFDDLGSDDVPLVGGKNASLGEMISSLKEQGVRVPDGFATTADGYRLYLDESGLKDKIRDRLDALDKGEKTLAQTGRSIRNLFQGTHFPEEMEEAILVAYRKLSKKSGKDEAEVAVRSSATAEDLPEASFAGQQETFLGVHGEEDLLEACRRCFASLFTDRAISYRQEKGFDHMEVALSVGVQMMVRSDLAGAGVMFSIDTETGFPDMVVINAAWGLGENVVQGAVTPDEYRVFKPLLGQEGARPVVERSLGAKEKKMIYGQGARRKVKNTDTSKRERSLLVLSDDEVLQLARWAVAIEDHYGRAMDMEWAKDGETGEIFIVQARPETVQSQRGAASFTTFALKEKGEELVRGLAIGQAVASGDVQVIESARDIEEFREGGVLVTQMTDPDWVPIMKKARAIITDHGGRTCHAAIVSRELGIPAIVGTGDATEKLDEGRTVTVSCAEGDTGFVYDGELEFIQEEIDLEGLPEVQTQIMMNAASPSSVFNWWRLPVKGIGLARMEFIVNNSIRIHPMALVNFNRLADNRARHQIAELTKGYEDKTEFFVDHLALGIGHIAAAGWPHPVIVRLSDFKTNEYAQLIGGAEFEPGEHNPMIGFRGASRYYSDRYRQGFALECRALRRVREKMGFTNVKIMVPFCRTLDEADKVLEVLAEEGLKRGENELEVYVMAEIPANILLAEEFAERFDGFSIGSNDLTQLILGVDRDSDILSGVFDERNEAVKRAVSDLIKRAHAKGTKVGICGQAPSDYPEFASFLVEQGIDSISLNPDSVVGVIRKVAETEKERS